MMNPVGWLAIMLFVAGWVGALVCLFAFDLLKAPNFPDSSRFKKLLIFSGFCALGPIAIAVAFLFGGFPVR
jgi:hypothetical protein